MFMFMEDYEDYRRRYFALIFLYVYMQLCARYCRRHTQQL